MSPYTVQYTPRADRDLEKLPPEIAHAVVHSIHTMKEDPYRFIKKMKSSSSAHPIYSLKVKKDIRVLLSIHDDVVIIHVLEIEHRKRSYRDF